jgi:hypothetical protein
MSVAGARLVSAWVSVMCNEALLQYLHYFRRKNPCRPKKMTTNPWLWPLWQQQSCWLWAWRSALALPKAKKLHLQRQRQSQRQQPKLLRQPLTHQPLQRTLLPRLPQRPLPRTHPLPNETSRACQKPASAGFFTALSCRQQVVPCL